VIEQFETISKFKKIPLTDPMKNFIRERLGSWPLTGSDVDAILVRVKERAVLAGRDEDLQVTDLEEAVSSFIDPLDPQLLELQELAAVLACSDRRFLPERFQNANRAELVARFNALKRQLFNRS